MFSTKGRYAIRLMIDLAKRQDDNYVALKDVALSQDISKKYLEIIVKDLVEAGLLEGKPGKSGGYKLSRKPEDYTVAEILEIMEGTLAPVACLEENAAPCPRASYCETLPMWKEFYDKISDFFYDKKISDLI
ncbi:MAG: Rrf2 family transcriptional regulator [Firmicutes bacterium]|nr:Rrf2 family transcriptional regulator [Bacillota bacterium]